MTRKEIVDLIEPVIKNKLVGTKHPESQRIITDVQVGINKDAHYCNDFIDNEYDIDAHYCSDFIDNEYNILVIIVRTKAVYGKNQKWEPLNIK